jgi:hypothetical protein
LAFTVQPGNTTAGAAITPAIQVAAQDQFGNTVASYTQMVGLAIGTNPAGGSLSGTSSKAAVAGVATFDGLSINAAGSGYTLVASRQSGPMLPSVTSAAFNITPGTATQLAFTQQPTSTTAGTTIAPAIQVTARDAQGNTVTGFTANITLAIGTNPPGTGALDGTTVVAAVAGVATFSVDIDEAGTGYTLTASATGPSSATSNPFNITAGAAAQMTISAGDGQAATAGTAVATAPAVLVTDAFGNPVADVSVTFTVTGGDGSISPASPATVQTNASGIAALTTWTLGITPGANTVQATSGSLTPVTFTATGT